MKFALTLLLLATAVFSADIDTIRERRYSEIVGATTGATTISAWLSTLGPDGKWPQSEVDLTTGCDAQTASWPAQEHWKRINTFAAAWHGGLRNALTLAGNASLRSSISLAMGYWFSQDFTVPACIDSGNTPACPCGTPGLWNTNWASNIILIPGWVGQVCLLLGSSLTASELAGCQRMTSRAYATFQTGINGVAGGNTGANSLDISSIGIDLALLTSNTSLLADAYTHVHNELAIKDGLKADGIRADGSFGQHTGILYNGNYGKDYVNDVLALEIAAGGTQYQAGNSSVQAFSILLLADIWMVFFNTVTAVAHWDYSVLGRFIAFPVADNQATANLKINLTQISVLGQEWGSADILQVYQVLSSTSSSVNLGITGNRMFYANDYMVHRGPGYVTTLKMYSKRTQNTECSNQASPFGFHLSDGASYTYIRGDEYEDLFPAFDWNLIPGTTVDYGATPLGCETARKTGTQPFVGGASDGQIGIAAMRYENPTTKALNWRKTWFFLEDDVQFVMVARLTSTTTAPVYSVLDQRRRNGDVFVSGTLATKTGVTNFTGATSLWHGGVGYIFNVSNPATSLAVQLDTRTGSWQDIGTSDEPPNTADFFTSYLIHNDLTTPGISYSIYPATLSLSAFQTKAQASKIVSIRNDGSISALLDVVHKTAFIAYWVDAGGSVAIPAPISGQSPVTVKSSGSLLVTLRLADTGFVCTVAEPTQTLANVTLTFTLGTGTTPPGWKGTAKTKTTNVTLPGGGEAGKSVTFALV
ncbi:polysaccharide lyase family 8 protein [Mycena floridula]|nr:polysaccharide lyase family 8 protein [Mycena floridula]